jgi:hypothetical protein
MKKSMRNRFAFKIDLNYVNEEDMCGITSFFRIALTLPTLQVDC